jgi:hypothetical protein
MRKPEPVAADELENFQKERQAEISQKSQARLEQRTQNPWAKSDFAPVSEVPKVDVPKPQHHQSSSSSSSSGDADLQKALALSMQQSVELVPSNGLVSGFRLHSDKSIIMLMLYVYIIFNCQHYQE